MPRWEIVYNPGVVIVHDLDVVATNAVRGTLPKGNDVGIGIPPHYS
jgi:hypothetical protein